MRKKDILIYFFAIYSAALVIQNVLAAKQFDIAIFTVTTGVLISPIVFIVQDVVSENYGYKTARKMVLLGFAMNFVGVVLYQIAIAITPSSVWGGQEMFESVLGTTTRITFASFLAYICGSLANSKIMVSLKKKFDKNLFFRAISSTVVGQSIDNFIFAFVAFYGVLPTNAIVSMVAGGTIFEVCYEVLFYPLTKKIIEKTKEYDKEGETDGTSKKGNRQENF